MILSLCTLTDDGTSVRPAKGIVDEGRVESVVCALCSGNAGVADLDISHALAKRNWGKKQKKTREKRLNVCDASFHPAQIGIVGREGVVVVKF